MYVVRRFNELFCQDRKRIVFPTLLINITAPKATELRNTFALAPCI